MHPLKVWPHQRVCQYFHLLHRQEWHVFSFILIWQIQLPTYFPPQGWDINCPLMSFQIISKFDIESKLAQMYQSSPLQGTPIQGEGPFGFLGSKCYSFGTYSDRCDTVFTLAAPTHVYSRLKVVTRPKNLPTQLETHFKTTTSISVMGCGYSFLLKLLK